MRNGSRWRHRGIFGPLWMILIGVLFLVQRYWGIRLHESWPVLVIAMGVFLLIDRLFFPGRCGRAVDGSNQQ